MSNRKEYQVAVDAEYANQMAAELRKLPKRAVTTAQSVSTQAILDRPAIADVPMWLRPPITGWEADKHAMRDITIEQYEVENKRRKASKNTLGQSEQSATTAERKDRAIQGFIYTPPAKLTAQEQLKMVQLQPIVELGPITQPTVEVKQSWFSRLFKRAVVDDIMPDRWKRKWEK